MRRFSQEALLDRALATGRLESRHFMALARQLADFQRTLPVASPATPFGKPGAGSTTQSAHPHVYPAPLQRSGRSRHSGPGGSALDVEASERLRPCLLELTRRGWIVKAMAICTSVT